MNTLTIDADVLKNLGIIAEDERLLKQVAKYLRRLVRRKEDDTLMSKEEFFARVEEATKGETHEMLPGENLTNFLKRRGYAL